jgi:phage terminase small subunit
MPTLKNRKWERFAVEIASSTPYHQAYVEAGYKDSPSARFNASRLANTPVVAARIAELQAAIADRSLIYAEYVQAKLLPIVLANARDLFEPIFDPDGKKTGDKLKTISDLPRELTAAISKIKVDPETGAVTEITLAGKTEAGTVLLRSVGGLVDRKELTGKGGTSLDAIVKASLQVIANVPENPDNTLPPGSVSASPGTADAAPRGALIAGQVYRM